MALIGAGAGKFLGVQRNSAQILPTCLKKIKQRWPPKKSF